MNEFSKYWNNICSIYFLTKHYLLLCEELSGDFDTFLQPVKEHRDAFDHIARVYGYKMLKEDITNIKQYQEANMRKAVGHTYRAFFDTADWLSYILRKEIRAILTNYDRECINHKYSNYANVKKLLNDVPEKIAKIREKKDLSDNENELIKEVREYSKTLEELLSCFNEIKIIFE